ncbi:transposase [Rhodococcus ruber]|uniref:Putative recombinase n=1 Tax=Rhodococcus ruber TaxID=1830 RepID=A0A098BNW7_9NOCA|nr:transposase family protein [Rhodococcus ruber]MCD2130083.1 transposase family protein [Rhodococcus ruber]MCZ4506545.1 transposase [Rhodococcus ruber]MCZ4533775.1 transposase [Rhodococcus ruber]MCZ4624013.1 transposase [Rhodococcus ruber]MDI9985473.1 transposase [Rhodococcus ruber]
MRLAYWRGNASSLHRELLEQEKQGGAPAPSLATLHRAIRQDISPGDRAGLREGERARRRFDVFLQRPPSHRNAAWEADHVEAPVQVEADGRLVRPWVTWFVDAAHDVILGVAVTPRIPNRESVLAALRAAVMRREPYGPAGGLPAAVRIDRGKDFLSRTVADALGAFAVRVDDLPAYGAHLKGTVETINGAAEKMLFAGLPRYTHRQTHVSGAPVDPDQPPLSFEAFTAEVLAWVRWWNTEHTLTELGERTPMQSWADDPTPIHDADETRLLLFTLEDDRRRRTITTKGVAFGRGRHYLADWMVGLVGTGVRIRYMPHHTGEIEVFDADTGAHLGTAILADAASAEDRARVLQARARKARALRSDLAAAERERRVRYAASTVPEPAQRLDAMTTAEAAAVLAAEHDADLARWARPDLIPFGPPPATWRLPVDPNKQARPDRDEDHR